MIRPANPARQEGTIMKKTLLCLLLACAIGSAHAHNGPSTTLSGASGLVALGSVVVVAGSISVVAASASVVVASVEVVGESVLIVLEGASEAASVTLKLSAAVAAGTSLVAGTAISVVTLASGYVLIAAGEAIAFIPTEIGKSMLHHSRHGGY
jgi:hypothetical protein